MSEFKEKVLKIVKSIPKGQTMSYMEVASKAGNKKASRAVGTMMAKNKNKEVPCHRVIRSDGSIGEYSGLRGKSKEEILRREGAIK